MAGSMDTGAAAPNVILITTHDLGRHLGCYGIETVDTPHIDELAATGVQFEDAIATTPVCSPSRGSLLTGRYPQSNGLEGLTHAPWWWRLDDREVTLPEHLGQFGYETHLVGLQHVAPDASRLGFDEQYAPDHDAEKMVQAAEDVASAMETGAPVYAQFGFFETHRPFDRDVDPDQPVSIPDYLEPSEELREDFQSFEAEIEYLDARVGELLETLEAHGQREETVILFVSDHGIPYPGAKWWCRSAGVGVSLLAAGPTEALAQPRDIATPISLIDVFPTVCSMLDLPIPSAVGGVDFEPYLRGQEQDAPREKAFTQFQGDGGSRGVITEEYNLIRNFAPGREVPYPVETAPTNRAPSLDSSVPPRPFAQLYDRSADPAELVDIADEHPERVDSLSSDVRSWMLAVEDELLRGPVPTPYYDRAKADFLGGKPIRDPD